MGCVGDHQEGIVTGAKRPERSRTHDADASDGSDNHEVVKRDV